MIVEDILIILFLLYLALGCILFNKGVKDLGGKEAYLDLVEEYGSKYPPAAFWLAMVIFIFIWPRYVRINIRRDNHDKR